MEEINKKYEELAAMKKQIEEMKREYAKEYKKMLIDFLKINGLDGYVQIEESVGILKVDKEETSSFPYALKFYPLKNNGVPSIKTEYFHCLITNDFEEILANVKAVKLEFTN